MPPTLFIAQQLHVSEQTSNTINVIIILLAVALLIKNLLKKDNPLPQPVVTRRQDEYALRHEFDQLRSDHAALAARVEKVHVDLMNAGEARAVKIHERFNVLIESMAEVRGRSEAISSALLERDPATHKVRAKIS